MRCVVYIFMLLMLVGIFAFFIMPSFFVVSDVNAGKGNACIKQDLLHSPITAALSQPDNLTSWHTQGMEAHERQEFRDASEWYFKAADAGYAPAQYDMGLLFEKGLGVSQDYVQASKWYRKAAEQGYAEAQFKLGALYEYGRGVPRNIGEAIVWYRKAAHQGYVLAQNRLARHYADGRNVRQQLTLAYFWSSLAAVRGDQKSARLCEEVARKMSSSELAKAQGLTAKGYRGM